MRSTWSCPSSRSEVSQLSVTQPFGKTSSTAGGVAYWLFGPLGWIFVATNGLRPDHDFRPVPTTCSLRP